MNGNGGRESDHAHPGVHPVVGAGHQGGQVEAAYLDASCQGEGEDRRSKIDCPYINSTASFKFFDISDILPTRFWVPR